MDILELELILKKSRFKSECDWEIFDANLDQGTGR